MKGSAHGECPTNLQKCTCRGTDHRFANHVKEQIRERRERAIAWLVPLVRVNGASKQKNLTDEPEEKALQEKEAPHCGRALSGHASRDAYPASRRQSGETGGPRRSGTGLAGDPPAIRHA